MKGEKYSVFSIQCSDFAKGEQTDVFDRILNTFPMRAVIQRVTNASVTIHGQVKAAITRGLLVLLAVRHPNTEAPPTALPGTTQRISNSPIGMRI